MVVICPASRNGRAGTAPACTWPRDSVISSTESATWTVPGAYDRGAAPRHRAVQRPVDLDRAGVELERVHRPGGGSRHVAVVQQPAVEQRCRHVGDHGPASAVPAPAGGAYGGRAAAVDLDRDDLGAGVDLRRRGPRAAGPAPAVSMPGAALGDGEADGLAEHRHQQAHQARARCVQRDVGVAGVAGEQQPGRRPRRTGSGRARWPGCSRVRTRSRPPARRSPGQATEAVPHRRERREQGADDAGRRSRPTGRRARARPHRRRAGGLQHRGGPVAVAVQQRPVAVGERVAEHRGCVPPGESVLLEVERPDRRATPRPAGRTS